MRVLVAPLMAMAESAGPATRAARPRICHGFERMESNALRT